MLQASVLLHPSSRTHKHTYALCCMNWLGLYMAMAWLHSDRWQLLRLLRLSGPLSSGQQLKSCFQMLFCSKSGPPGHGRSVIPRVFKGVSLVSLLFCLLSHAPLSLARGAACLLLRVGSFQGSC